MGGIRRGQGPGRQPRAEESPWRVAHEGAGGVWAVCGARKRRGRDSRLL